MLISSCSGFLCQSLNLLSQKTSIFVSNTVRTLNLAGIIVCGWCYHCNILKWVAWNIFLRAVYRIQSNPNTAVGAFICGSLVKKLCAASSDILHYPNVTKIYVFWCYIYVGKEFSLPATCTVTGCSYFLGLPDKLHAIIWHFWYICIIYVNWCPYCMSQLLSYLLVTVIKM